MNNSAASQVVSLAPAQEIRLLLPKKYDPELLTVDPEPSAQSVDAPVYSGDVLGSVSVSYDGELLGTSELLAINDVAKSDMSAAAAGTTSYIQSNWWKWVIFVIVLAIAACFVLLVLVQIRRVRARRARMEQRRRALEQRRRKFREEFDHEDL